MPSYQVQLPSEYRPGGTPLTPGKYVCAVTAIELREGKESGQPYLNWELEVIDDDSEFVGRKLFMSTSFSEKAVWKLQEVLYAIGVENTGSLEFDTDDFINSTVMAVVINKSRDGEVVHEVKRVEPYDSQPPVVQPPPPPATPIVARPQAATRPAAGPTTVTRPRGTVARRASSELDGV